MSLTSFRPFCAAVLLPGAPASSADAPLSHPERTIATAAKAQESRAVALLTQIVDVNSGTMNFAGVRKVADILRPQFDALGFTTKWVDGAPFGRAGHLVAERKGSGPHVLLIGHLDTVFEPHHPFQRAERVDEHILKGPGTSDMKGGLVVGLAALTALKEARVLDRLHVTFVMHGDEEDS